MDVHHWPCCDEERHTSKGEREGRIMRMCSKLYNLSSQIPYEDLVRLTSSLQGSSL